MTRSSILLRLFAAYENKYIVEVQLSQQTTTSNCTSIRKQVQRIVMRHCSLETKQQLSLTFSIDNLAVVTVEDGRGTVNDVVLTFEHFYCILSTLNCFGS